MFPNASTFPPVRTLVAPPRFILDAAHLRRPLMSEHVYKILELTGSSPTSIEDAVANAIAKAAKTVRRMQWFQVLETRGHIADGNVSHWQVTVKVGFTLD